MWRLANQGEAWRMNMYTNLRETLLESFDIVNFTIAPRS